VCPLHRHRGQASSTAQDHNTPENYKRPLNINYVVQFVSVVKPYTNLISNKISLEAIRLFFKNFQRQESAVQS